MTRYTLVPNEITVAMADASGCEGYFGVSAFQQAQDMWDRMLSVAPNFSSENITNCYNTVIEYCLYLGIGEEGLEFLRYWNKGDFDTIRAEWPDAPKDIFWAEPTYSGAPHEQA